MEFGLDPISTLSFKRKEGSNTCKALSRLLEETFANSSLLTTTAFPVKLSLFLVKYPFTTTSSISATSSSITIFSTGCFVYFTSCFFIPVNENTRTIFSISGNCILNLPSTSVATPMVVPLIKTETPGSGLPSLSLTVPCKSRAV